MSHPIRSTTLPAGRCPECDHFAPAGGEIGTCSRCQCTRHAAPDPRSPYMGHDPQSPPGAEAALQAFSCQLDAATEKLREARDAELEAEEARDAAKWEATLSPECPQPGVYDGVRITVAYRDAWVAREIAPQESAYRAARVVRQAASAHLDKVKSQASVQQTIAKAVATVYQGTGREGW